MSSKNRIHYFKLQHHTHTLPLHHNVNDATLWSDQGRSMVTVRVHYPAVSTINPPPFIQWSQICLHQSTHHLEPQSWARPCEGTRGSLGLTCDLHWPLEGQAGSKRVTVIDESDGCESLVGHHLDAHKPDCLGAITNRGAIELAEMKVSGGWLFTWINSKHAFLLILKNKALYIYCEEIIYCKDQLFDLKELSDLKQIFHLIKLYKWNQNPLWMLWWEIRLKEASVALRSRISFMPSVCKVSKVVFFLL